MDYSVNSMYPRMIDYSVIIRKNQEYIEGVLNKRYWPYHIVVRHNVSDVERWCYENFKSSEWRNVGTTFAFKRKEDYAFFMLRWS
jgi:hypothetical protein